MLWLIKETFSFVIYHKHVSDRWQNILTPPVGRNKFSNSVGPAVLYCSLYATVSTRVSEGPMSHTSARGFALVVDPWPQHLLTNPVKLTNFTFSLKNISFCNFLVNWWTNNLYSVHWQIQTTANNCLIFGIYCTLYVNFSLNKNELNHIKQWECRFMLFSWE